MRLRRSTVVLGLSAHTLAQTSQPPFDDRSPLGKAIVRRLTVQQPRAPLRGAARETSRDGPPPGELHERSLALHPPQRERGGRGLARSRAARLERSAVGAIDADQARLGHETEVTGESDGLDPGALSGTLPRARLARPDAAAALRGPPRTGPLTQGGHNLGFASVTAQPGPGRACALGRQRRYVRRPWTPKALERVHRALARASCARWSTGGPPCRSA